MKFICCVAQTVADVCKHFPEYPVILSGGCFQNAVLTRKTREVLQEQERLIGCHKRIPPNDGGLATGQLAVAAAQLSKGML